MSKRKHTTEELRKSSNHLHYELQMFQGLVRGMGSGIAGERNVISNSLVEAFAIHVRVLIHFFYSSPIKDDVVAEDFIENWEIPNMTEILEVAKDRADKEVAHLTFARLKVTPDQKGWNFLEISNDLQAVINKFIELVPREILGDRWEDTIGVLIGDDEAG